MPDIGMLFPDTEGRWKGTDSREFLRIVWARVRSQGWEVQNVDSTVLAEAPKLSPYYGAMKREIAAILGVKAEQIGIKATTCERLGFVGRREGVLASAIVLLARTRPRA